MNIQNELNKATFDSRFATLPDGTMVYKPAFSKTRYIVPSLKEKDRIKKFIELKQDVISSGFALSLFFVFMNKWLGFDVFITGYSLTIIVPVVIQIMMHIKMVKGLERYTADNQAVNAN
ncbi:hypothetical protein B1757_07430 [Acidithiobacillus marinus]|uniref:Uncharacterized protein n=1 Tax=Acidithiobacillus marinus TaxID=187490 RepID=A0A2I1DLM7_9PROT|nr:hypothetical protein [Acidithiobacillus marinus]PKY10782.1 hypothetical protein B1757_07430 [Acidithiobacillus marinus]